VVEAEAVTIAVDRAQARYDRDGEEHHNVVSALISRCEARTRTPLSLTSVA
jgi:replication-associated recombination protein RarA